MRLFNTKVEFNLFNFRNNFRNSKICDDKILKNFSLYTNVMYEYINYTCINPYILDIQVLHVVVVHILVHDYVH